MPTASIVIVTLNSLPYIERCLSSVEGQHVIVVDHGSTDGTLEFIRERFPRVHVIQEANRGFGAGSNVGIEASDDPYVLLLNPDAWLCEGALDSLVAFAEANPQVAAAGPLVRHPDGSIQATFRAFPTLWRLATQYFFLSRLAPRWSPLNAFYGAGFEYDRVREADFLLGCCLLLRRTAFDRVGGFDEDYFLFTEETDLCKRLWNHGWTVAFFPGAEAIHVGAWSTSREMAPLHRYKEQERGHLRFFLKHYGRSRAEHARWLLIGGYTLRSVVARGTRRGVYWNMARWLSSGNATTLLGQP